MLDAHEVKKQAEAEIREEQLKAAKDKIKVLLRKKEQAKAVLANIEREIADAYAEIGAGAVDSQPTSPSPVRGV